MKKILLVGCGNIGSRHLQALAKIQDELIIEIIEPNSDNAKIGKERLNEISSTKSHTISWKTSLEYLSPSDFVIVSTPAMGRAQILSKLLDMGNTNFLIEKLVCQSKKEYILLLKNFENKSANGWVNTTRRYFEIYQNIKKSFEGKPFNLSVNAGDSSLGSNAIHFLDLFSWITDEFELKLNGDYLLPKISNNKKYPELLEFFGTITTSTSKNSFLNISFLPYADLPLTLTFQNENNHFVVDETNRNVYFFKNSDNLQLTPNQEYSSTFMTRVFNDILLHGTCDLPSLKQSSFSHIELFRIFNNHIKKIQNKTVELCPIS